MTAAAVAADFHQPLDVHRDLLAEIAFHAALLFEHAADLAHVVLGQILHADVGTDAGLSENRARPMPSDAIDVREADFNPLGARKIDASNSRHDSSLPFTVYRLPFTVYRDRYLPIFSPAAACVSGSSRSPGRRRAGGRSCTYRKCA